MKKNWKAEKIISVMMIAVLVLAVFGACAPDPEEEPAITEPIVIAALNGPTGMGMVKLMDQTEKYAITTYQAPDEISGKVITGEVDMACVPSNLAAVLYNKTGGKIVSVSVETLGVLYVVENGTQTVKSIDDLEGRTIYASGKGGSPEYILQKLLDEGGTEAVENVDVQWLASHTDVATSLMASEGSVALLPEPFVTVVTSKNPSVTMVLDCNVLWTEVTGQDLPMGVLVAQKSFVEERASDLEIFLQDYRESVDFVNESPADAAQLIAEWGFIADPAVAEKAIPNCNIVLYDEDTAISRDMLKAFYQVLFEMNPASVGGALPDDGLYY